MKKTLFLWLTLLLSAVCVSAQRLEGVGVGNLCEGDLLFCAQVKGNNITDVTQGVGGMKIDHVAIFHRQGGRTFALEAIHSGVGLTPIDSFMARREAVLAARLKDTLGVARSVERALEFIGRPYDFNFIPDDSAFYCSELVQKCYRDSRGELVFKPIPMSFHDKSGRITPYWHDYYARQGLQVPEGEPGSNPGDLSRSAAICILGIVEKE